MSTPLIIPHLQSAPTDPLSYGKTTCYAAGHLVSKNAGWRQLRPVVKEDACTACLQCYLYCPDGTIRKTHAEKDDNSQAAVFIDLDFCKGCGICCQVCKFDAISMVPESEFVANDSNERKVGVSDSGASDSSESEVR